MATQIKRLEQFLTAQLAKAPDDDRVRSFCLFHSKPGGALGRQLDAYVPEEDNPPSRMAKDILFQAQGDADVFPLVQHYALIAYRDSDPENGIASLPFKVRPKSDAEDGEQSEPPTQAGITTQLMRHLENTQKTHSAAQEGFFRQMLKFVELQSDELTKHRQSAGAVMEAREQLMLERVSVQHEALLREVEDEKGENESKALVWEVAEKYLPAAMPVLMQALQQLVGGGVNGSAPDLINLVKTMDDEQKLGLIGGIAQTLSPDEMKGLGAMLLTAGDQASAQTAPIESTTPTETKNERHDPTPDRRTKRSARAGGKENSKGKT